jgi:hypothetical protein
MEDWKGGIIRQFDNSTPDSYRGDNWKIGIMEDWNIEFWLIEIEASFNIKNCFIFRMVLG